MAYGLDCAFRRHNNVSTLQRISFTIDKTKSGQKIQNQMGTTILCDCVHFVYYLVLYIVIIKKIKTASTK